MGMEEPPQGRVREVRGTVSVETPEQIDFTFELAGPGARMLAYFIDFLIRISAVGIIAFVIMMAMGWASPGLATGLILILLFAVEWGYYTLFEWLWHGSTPGKRALRLRVVRTDGIAVDLLRSSMRNLLRAADLFPMAYGTGLLVMFLTGTQRRLGDLAADTMVIREERTRLRELPPLPEGAVPLPAGAIREIRLRERDLALIDEFFRRRRLFSADRARELAGILAEPVARQLDLGERDPEEVLAGLLVAGHELRSSWYGRSTGLSLGGGRRGGGA